MNFTANQLQKMGEVAGEMRQGITVEQTNLHEGSTIVMKGTARGSSRQMEVLVTANGQTQDVSAMAMR